MIIFLTQTWDPLTYIITGNSSITVKINSSTNIVSFSQPTRWTGTEYIIFNATDDNEESVESNNISLTVTSAPTPSLTGIDPEGTTVGPAPTPSPKPPTPVKIKRKMFYIKIKELVGLIHIKSSLGEKDK